MKKVALITTNNILAQSFEAAVNAMSDLNIELFLLLKPMQVILDTEILQIDVALIDMGLSDLVAIKDDNKCVICEELNNKLPNCHLLLLVSQYDKVNRKIAEKAKRENIIDDFFFYDASLQYIFAKLSTF